MGFASVCGLWHIPQLPPCGSLAGIEGRQELPHLVAAEALARAGGENADAESRLTNCASAVNWWQELQYSCSSLGSG